MRRMNATLDTVLLISIGAVLGANARHWLGTWVNQSVQTAFPYATLLINVSGSFLLALLYTIAVEKSVISPRVGLALFTGFFGSFTTFSTFMLESLQLIEQAPLHSFLNIVSSVLLGLFAAAGGIWLGKSL